jgi:F-type H+-transporting ATPase subunit b
MDSLLGTFHINLQAVVFQMINFGIVFAILYFAAIRPLMKMLDARNAKIAQGVEDAKRNAALVSESEIAYKSELEKARKEAFEIVQSAKKDAEAKREEIIAQTNEQVARMLSEGKAELSREKDTIIKDAQKQMTGVVIDAAEKALDDVLADGSLDKQLIEKRIHDHAK